MKIYIENFKVETLIGVYDFERKRKQKILCDIEIEFELPENFNDSIKETIDYDILIKDLKEFIEKRTFYTLEKLCIEIIEFIFKNKIVKSVRCRIKKFLKFRDCKNIYIEERKAR